MSPFIIQTLYAKVRHTNNNGSCGKKMGLLAAGSGHNRAVTYTARRKKRMRKAQRSRGFGVMLSQKYRPFPESWFQTKSICHRYNSRRVVTPRALRCMHEMDVNADSNSAQPLSALPPAASEPMDVEASEQKGGNPNAKRKWCIWRCLTRRISRNRGETPVSAAFALCLRG